MITSFALLFAALVQRVASTRNPLLQWDPDTVEDCVEWYNNGEGESCEYVRSYYTITPEEFHEWNPSVGLDCTPWRWQSYCIVTQRRLDRTKTTTTSFEMATTSTSTVPSLAPSPTVWEALGCYAQNPNRPMLEQNMNLDGDASLSVSKCQNSCYRSAYPFAGVQEGNQCWCSSYVGGEWAKNQTDCNTPCTGNKAKFCGGKGVVNVFEASPNDATVVTASMITTSIAGTSMTSTSVKAAATSNGAIKNKAMLWRNF